MSAEFWAIIGVGVALGGLLVKQSLDIADLRERLVRVETQVELLLRGLHIEVKGGGEA